MKSFLPNIFFQKYFLILTLFSFLIVSSLFLVNLFELNFQLKLVLYIVSIILLFFANYLIFKQLSAQTSFSQTTENNFVDEFEEKLLLLEEVGNSFSSRLNTNDLFNLLAGRINEIINFETAVLFIKPNDSDDELKASNIFGKQFSNLQTLKFKMEDNFIGKAYKHKIVSYDNDLRQNSGFPSELPKCGLSICLENNSNFFGVLTLFRHENFLENDIKNFEVIGYKISPAFQISQNLEQNIHTALTDSLTGLANERAFYLILEQQIAEAERFQELRPLTLLSVDLVNFDEINLKLGYANGDQILLWTATLIKNQLRKMDVLARILGDEFLIILPTANQEVTEKIAKRISLTVENNPFIHSDSSKIHIKLNIGTATYKPNFDSTHTFVKNALENKESKKTSHKSTVIPFPKT